MRRKRTNGTSLVETALVFPFIVMIIIGIIEYGRYYFTDAVLYNAAREGARVGIIQPTNVDAITTAVRAMVPGLGGQNVGVSVSTPNGTAHGAEITVNVSYNTALSVPFFAKKLNFVRSSTMLIE